MSLRAFRQNRSSGTYRQNTQDLHGLTDRNGQADRLPARKYSPSCGAELRKKEKGRICCDSGNCYSAPEIFGRTVLVYQYDRHAARGGYPL